MMPAHPLPWLRRCVGLAWRQLRAQPSFAAMMVLALALGHATVSTTLGMARLAERAGRASVQASGLHVVQVEFEDQPEGRLLKFAPVQLRQLLLAVPLARAALTFGAAEVMLERGTSTRRAQLLTSPASDMAPLLGLLDELPPSPGPWCLVDSDQAFPSASVAAPGLLHLLPSGLALSPRGRFAVQGPLLQALRPGTSAVWVPETVFLAAAAQTPVRSLLQVHLRSAELPDAMEATTQLRRFLALHYPALQARVSSPWDTVRESQEMAAKVGRLCVLAGVAIALLSVVGMANAVLVSVRQRQLDIGIRQAIGALPRDIVGQIVAETLMLAALAAGVGNAVSLLAGYAWCRFADWPWELDIALLSATTSATLLAGGCASLLPARMALRLDPIEVLRG